MKDCWEHTVKIWSFSSKEFRESGLSGEEYLNLKISQMEGGRWQLVNVISNPDSTNNLLHYFKRPADPNQSLFN